MTDNEREAPIIDEHTDPAWQAIGDALGNLGYDLNSHEDTAAWVQQYLFRHSEVRAGVVAEEPEREYGRLIGEAPYQWLLGSNGIQSASHWRTKAVPAGPWVPVKQETRPSPRTFPNPDNQDDGIGLLGGAPRW